MNLTGSLERQIARAVINNDHMVLSCRVPITYLR
jgi:hypothetical protein